MNAVIRWRNSEVDLSAKVTIVVAWTMGKGPLKIQNQHCGRLLAFIRSKR